MKKILILAIGMVMFCLAAIPGEIWAYEPSDFLKNNFPELVRAYTPPAGSVPADLSRLPRVRQWLMNRPIASDTEINYYGADLTQFPPRVREWVMNTRFTKDRMEMAYMVNSELRAWWSDDNNVAHFEASYTIAPRYAGAGTRTIWGQNSRYNGSSNIFQRYGEHARFYTFRFNWDFSQLVENMLKNDPMYAEIIDFAMQLSDEIEYDWSNFSEYRGQVRRTPGKRYAICAGYAEEVMEKALRLNSVQSVQWWKTPGHEWNCLILTDGRTLYFDLTWFDNEHINYDTGEIYLRDDYLWMNITFNKEIFDTCVGHSGVSYHAIGQLVAERKK